MYAIATISIIIRDTIYLPKLHLSSYNRRNNTNNINLHVFQHFLKNIFDFTTDGDWDCVAAVERLPALHYSVDIIFLSFGIMGFIVEL